jgi:hypothetical protein
MQDVGEVLMGGHARFSSVCKLAKVIYDKFSLRVDSSYGKQFFADLLIPLRICF